MVRVSSMGYGLKLGLWFTVQGQGLGLKFKARVQCSCLFAQITAFVNTPFFTSSITMFSLITFTAFSRCPYPGLQKCSVVFIKNTSLCQFTRSGARNTMLPYEQRTGGSVYAQERTARSDSASSTRQNKSWLRSCFWLPRHLFLTLYNTSSISAKVLTILKQQFPCVRFRVSMITCYLSLDFKSF